MTDRPLGDSELDAAIDRAVRDLMGAEPRADLRERVLSELAGGSSELARTSARATLWPRLAFGLVAATAAIVIAVQFADRPAERPAEQTIAARAAPEERPRTDGTPLPPAVRADPTALTSRSAWTGANDAAAPRHRGRPADSGRLHRDGTAARHRADDTARPDRTDRPIVCRDWRRRRFRRQPSTSNRWRSSFWKSDH